MYGWRPTSVVIQPHSTARNPVGAISTAARCSHGLANSFPRSRAQPLHSPSRIIASPTTIMMRKVQKIRVAGGRSSRGKALRPSTRPFQSWVRMNEPSFGISSA